MGSKSEKNGGQSFWGDTRELFNQGFTQEEVSATLRMKKRHNIERIRQKNQMVRAQKQWSTIREEREKGRGYQS